MDKNTPRRANRDAKAIVDTKVIPNILTPSKSFKTEYKWVEDFIDKQQNELWLAKNYDMKADMHVFRTELTKPERMMIVETLKLFSHYETNLGTEFWGGAFIKMFPKKEFQQLGSLFSMVENVSHLTFYTQMMDALGFNTEEFYNSPYQDEVLSDRLGKITKAFKEKDNLKKLAVFTFLEGTALFSSIAALMSFRAPGSINCMTNMASGIIHSAVEEDLHSQASAMCYKTLKSEMNLTPEETLDYQVYCYDVAKDILEHEYLIIDKLFSYGEIRSIKKEDLKLFVEHRTLYCLNLLGYKVESDCHDNKVASWFYILAKSYNMGDFFVSQQKDYENSVNKTRFTW
jgi:ribonucleotide reductase beta subunit family protein with ferritin-like domain